MKLKDIHKSLVGVDVGGTKIDAGRIHNNKIVERSTIDTQAHLPEKDVVANIIRAIENVIEQDTYSIGIGVPGFVDIEKGIVRGVNNIPSWKNVELKKQLEEYFNIPVLVNNDANCFAIGEKYYGKGTGYKDFVGITLGTGLGSGIVLNGKLFTGSNYGSGEFGCIPYLDNNYEYYCSSSFFTNIHSTTGKDIYKRVLSNDDDAKNIMVNFGEHIGNAIKTIMYSFDPQAIIIGGSIAGSFDLFKDSMWNVINTFHDKSVVEKLIIEKSELESAILGAAGLTYQYLN